MSCLFHRARQDLLLLFSCGCSLQLGADTPAGCCCCRVVRSDAVAESAGAHRRPGNPVMSSLNRYPVMTTGVLSISTPPLCSSRWRNVWYFTRLLQTEPDYNKQWYGGIEPRVFYWFKNRRLFNHIFFKNNAAQYYKSVLTYPSLITLT